MIWLLAISYTFQLVDLWLPQGCSTTEVAVGTESKSWERLPRVRWLYFVPCMHEHQLVNCMAVLSSPQAGQSGIRGQRTILTIVAFVPGRKQFIDT